MKISRNLIAGFMVIVTLASCSEPTTKTESKISSEALLADTIVYPVRIKNLNPEDEWATQRLKNLNRQKLVDDAFEAVYSGKAQAFNYLTDSPIEISSLKQQETDGVIKRDDVVELEFRETWRYDASGGVFEKKVHSILLASALYDSDGSIRGMKAIFYVKMKN